jgi:Xaa-Pro aminopeptidase
MYKQISTEFFVGNRQRLKSLFAGTAPIVITANGLLQRNSDVVFPFRQDSSFWYLTGIDDPDVILVMDRGKEYLITPATNDTRIVFDGQTAASELSARSGIEQVYPAEEGWRQLNKRLKKAKHVATLAAPKPFMAQQGFYTNPTKAQLITNLKAANPDIKLLDLRPHLARMRVIKQAPELAAIKRAIAITSRAIKAVQKRSFVYEYQIEAALTAQFRRSGASGHGFAPIVAGGPRACVLHNVSNNSQLESDQLVVLDAGAEIDNYSADITRTYMPKGGTTSKRQREVQAAVVAVQDYALSLVKPGAYLKANEQLVEHFMGEKLRELGLIKTISSAAVREFFPHSTSHFMGLDVHDVGDYQQPLAAGMVLTVEPGIYIPAEGLGVRIEDDVLVNTKGATVLSSGLPRSLT